MMMSAPKARVRYSIRSRGGYCGFSSKTFAVMITLHPLWTTLPPSILMPLESSRYDEPTYRPAIELSVIEAWLDAGAQTSFVGWHITTDINSDCCRVVFERYHSYARISCPMVLNIFIEIFFYSVFLKKACRRWVWPTNWEFTLITILFVGTGFASFIAYLVPKVLLMIVSTYLVTSVSSLIWVKSLSTLRK